jgi:hypothetical protein
MFEPSLAGGFIGLGLTMEHAGSTEMALRTSLLGHRGDAYARATLAAWSPLGPVVRSNSTVSPSFRLRYPDS